MEPRSPTVVAISSSVLRLIRVQCSDTDQLQRNHRDRNEKRREQRDRPSSLNLFRCFPDLETSELVVRHLSSRRVIGLQIKTIGVDAPRPDGTVSVLASSFRRSPTTYVVVLAWRSDERRFDDECLLIPSTELDAIAQLRGIHLSFEWHPGSPTASQLDSYRGALRALPSVVLGRISSEA